MKIKLKVAKGSSTGKEVKIPTPKCLIGRGDDCHMRPKSEAISRRHCVIFVKNAKVYVRDLKSRNGTHVNQEKISSDQELQPGDELSFGPLSFEVLIDYGLGGEKKPKITSIKEAAVRTTGATEGKSLDDSSITDWLDEADEAALNRRKMDPETRQFKLDETDQLKLQRAKDEAEKEEAEKEEAAEDSAESEKKEPGKLPEHLRQKFEKQGQHNNSRDAAADMLKKFFNNR